MCVYRQQQLFCSVYLLTARRCICGGVASENLPLFSESWWRSIKAWTRPPLSPWITPPTVRKSSVPLKAPSVGASSEDQQHFKWNVRVSRHTVINFSSASGFEAGEGAGQAPSRGLSEVFVCVWVRGCVCGGRAPKTRNNKNPLFTTYEQRAANKVSVQRLRWQILQTRHKNNGTNSCNTMEKIIPFFFNLFLPEIRVCRL